MGKKIVLLILCIELMFSSVDASYFDKSKGSGTDAEKIYAVQIRKAGKFLENIGVVSDVEQKWNDNSDIIRRDVLKIVLAIKNDNSDFFDPDLVIRKPWKE